MPKSRKARRFEPPKKAENIASTVSAPTTTAPTPTKVPTPARAPSTKVKSIAERYPYIGAELKRIAWLTVAIMVILVITFFVLR